jgi:prepilin-type N-terminal cleavage/methylation domain-containing protein
MIKQNRNKGMSLPEVLIGLTIFGFVVTGSIGAALLFAKIASSHENNSDFQRDIRSGFETLSYDSRNAARVVTRSQTGFVLGYLEKSDVTYSYNPTNGTITRTDDSASVKLFRNVSEFDVLENEADATGNSSLGFDASKISIETLSFEAANGGGTDSALTISNFTFRIRNS